MPKRCLVLALCFCCSRLNFSSVEAYQAGLVYSLESSWRRQVCQCSRLARPRGASVLKLRGGSEAADNQPSGAVTVPADYKAITGNLQDVLGKIFALSNEFQWPPARLVAVSKFQTKDAILAAYKAGQVKPTLNTPFSSAEMVGQTRPVTVYSCWAAAEVLW